MRTASRKRSRRAIIGISGGVVLVALAAVALASLSGGQARAAALPGYALRSLERSQTTVDPSTVRRVGSGPVGSDLWFASGESGTECVLITVDNDQLTAVKCADQAAFDRAGVSTSLPSLTDGSGGEQPVEAYRLPERVHLGSVHVPGLKQAGHQILVGDTLNLAESARFTYTVSSGDPFVLVPLRG